jgi:hypothetical protein
MSRQLEPTSFALKRSAASLAQNVHKIRRLNQSIGPQADSVTAASLRTMSSRNQDSLLLLTETGARGGKGWSFGCGTGRL